MTKHTTLNSINVLLVLHSNDERFEYRCVISSPRSWWSCRKFAFSPICTKLATLFEVGEVAFHNFKICNSRTAPIAVTTEAIALLTRQTRHWHCMPSTRCYKYTIGCNFMYFHRIGTNECWQEISRNVLQHSIFFLHKFCIGKKLQRSKVGAFLFSRLQIHKTNCGFQYINYVALYTTPQCDVKVRKQNFFRRLFDPCTVSGRNQN